MNRQYQHCPQCGRASAHYTAYGRCRSCHPDRPRVPKRLARRPCARCGRPSGWLSWAGECRQCERAWQRAADPARRQGQEPAPWELDPATPPF